MHGYPFLAQRILLSLGYADQFRYPLTLIEVWQRLIVSRPAALRRVADVLLWLISHDLVRSEKRLGVRYYQLGFRYGLSAQRIAHTRLAEQKLSELQPLVQLVSKLPWVEALAVTGSVAVKNARWLDDTDLLVVVRPGSLWLVRPLLIAYAWLLGKRRSWRAEEPNSWCFNLWLESTQLEVAPRFRSVYTAHEVLQAEWVFDRVGVAKLFLSSNCWVAHVLPGLYAQRQMEQRIHGLNGWAEVGVMSLLWITSPVWRAINLVLYILQRLYMQPHKTRERVSFSAAYFHPRDTRVSIGDAWRQSLRSLFSAVPEVGQQMRSADQLPVSIALGLEEVRRRGKDVVLATGVFDVLHEEHVQFLEKAAACASFLLVGIESDVRVTQIKGRGRPIFAQHIRASQVAAVPAVGGVVILPTQFGEPTQHQQFLAAVRPQFLAVSASSSHLDKKQAVIEMVGGKMLVVHEHNPAVSSTQLLTVSRSSNSA